MDSDRVAYIYNDAGASELGVEQWRVRCAQLGFTHDTIDAAHIARGGLRNADMFILPGGADVPYCKKLNGTGNKEIRAFVERGGLFVGVCAGAYYAHASIEWTNTTSEETYVIKEKRELRFFSTCARGPLVPYAEKSEAGARCVNMQYKKLTARAYYNGGPIMRADEDTYIEAAFFFEGATYPAAMSKKIGCGRAIVFALHFEYTAQALHSLNVAWFHHTPSAVAESDIIFLEIMRSNISR